MTVLVLIGNTQRKFVAIKDDAGRVHIAGPEANLDLLVDELHGNIVGGLVNGNGSIFADFAGDAVKETLIKPFCGFGDMDSAL